MTNTPVVSPQWESRATRATRPCATGKILCWTLTASRPSTPRLADPTTTTTTTTTPRASVRTSNPAWCELSCSSSHHKRLFLNHFLEDLYEDVSQVAAFTRLPCFWDFSKYEGNEWRTRLRPLKKTTSPVWTLTSVFSSSKEASVCSCNTCKLIILHVTILLE